jgi:hypothetical protein
VEQWQQQLAYKVSLTPGGIAVTAGAFSNQGKTYFPLSMTPGKKRIFRFFKNIWPDIIRGFNLFSILN